MPLITETEMRLKPMGNHMYWETTLVKKQKRMEIIEAIAQGQKQKDIYEEYGVTKQYVSKLKKEATEEGLLNRDGQLTEKGKTAIRNN